MTYMALAQAKVNACVSVCVHMHVGALARAKSKGARTISPMEYRTSRTATSNQVFEGSTDSYFPGCSARVYLKTQDHSLVDLA